MEKVKLKMKTGHLRELQICMELWISANDGLMTREANVIYSIIKPLEKKLRKKVIDKEGVCASKTFRIGLDYHQAWSLNMLLLQQLPQLPATSYMRNSVGILQRQIDQKL